MRPSARIVTVTLLGILLGAALAVLGLSALRGLERFQEVGERPAVSAGDAPPVSAGHAPGVSTGSAAVDPPAAAGDPDLVQPPAHHSAFARLVREAAPAVVNVDTSFEASRDTV